jgi:hypothetical protein
MEADGAVGTDPPAIRIDRGHLMMTELHRKGGCLCQPAKEGKLRCPLIVRPTSEDVVTGNLFQALKIINPRWWLPDLLNQALGVTHFRRQVFRRLRIEPWQNKPNYPRELLPWAEGSTQVDVNITWENPPTTLYIEMKYGSDLSSCTSRNHGEHRFPADQLLRNARVGLLECGYFERPLLFPTTNRDFLLLVISPDKGHSLVARYRDPVKLRKAIPHSDLISKLPKLPFIGELSYLDIVTLLRSQRRWLTRPEKILVDQITEYLEMKLATRPQRIPLEQHLSLLSQSPEASTGNKDVDLFPDQGVSDAEATASPTGS